MNQFLKLDMYTRSLIVGSILGDGEITKIYKNSRRKNHSYREHFGVAQLKYREWKQHAVPQLFYITIKTHTLRSRSLQLFTELYPYFYNNAGKKQIPFELFPYCDLLTILAVLYMDDGSLCLSKRINTKQKSVCLSPHIALYLQCYSYQELVRFSNILYDQLNLNLRLSKRKDGLGYILKSSKIDDTLNFLSTISPVTKTCESMRYKTDWEYRFSLEKNKYKIIDPEYVIVASCSYRNKNYSNIEVERMITLKQQKKTDQFIADAIGRSYWSVVYKLSELRKNGHLL
ncbi:DNA endonuclease [Fictibacillus sp. B-59209]|uniref:DNA endonuclease n=1 Tax=Fictibacillus sp. B-59209 TaxID=3024873 RepID=UPI002E21466B|nr:DNA endonuclease [Fictibacillus sp. B-59209]